MKLLLTLHYCNIPTIENWTKASKKKCSKYRALSMLVMLKSHLKGIN